MSIRILPLVKPVVELAKAAASLPQDWSAADQDRAWLHGMSDPGGDLVAVVAQQMAGQEAWTTGAAADYDAALEEAGCPVELQPLVVQTCEHLGRVLSGPTGFYGAAPGFFGANATAAGIDPAQWAALVQMIIAFIEMLRKRRNPDA